MVEGLKGKHKNLGFIEHVEPGRDVATNKPYFTVTWSLNGYKDITGVAQDFNKQKARHLAAQRFLKALFNNPESLLKGTHFTWISLLEYVSSNKRPLNEILDILDWLAFVY